MKHIARYAVVVGLLAFVQCAEPNSPDRDDAGAVLNGLIVSGPTVPGGTVTAAADDAEVVYVSLPPGTLPPASTVEIRNRTRNGAPVNVVTVDGGFDPVPIAARAADVLEVKVIRLDGVTLGYRATVPKRRPPSVVRTNPPRGRTDVAFNTRPLIVFSEPVNPATIHTVSVGLYEAGAAVTGATALVTENEWTAEFTPAAALKPGTTYQLVITRDVRDLDGDALEAAVTVEFSTAISESDGLSGRIAFVSGGSSGRYVYIANADGSGLTRLPGGPGDYGRPRWSPDGRRIVLARFDQGLGYSLEVIDADAPFRSIHVGSGMDPAWSPDGRKIVFASWPGIGIHMMNADGSGVTRITDPNDPKQCTEGSSAADRWPDWSPDGRRIVFERRFHTDEGGFDCGLDGWGYIPQVHVVNIDGTGLRRLTSEGPNVDDREPVWSPDGQSIAYWSRCCGLAVIDGEGTGPARPVFGYWPHGGGAHYSPAWSPRGKHLLFLVLYPTENRLYVTELATGVVRILHFPTVPGYILHPSWSPAR